MGLVSIVAGALTLCGLLPLVILYNALVRRSNAVDQATGSVAAHLKQRFDLIPALVDVTKAHMGHERELFGSLAALREQPLSHGASPDQLATLEAASRRAIGGILARAESYPTLGSSESFVAVQRSLHQVEEQLAAARRAYNSSVVEFNNSVDVFPNVLFAGLLGFRRRTVFQVTGADTQPTNVKALFGSAT